MSFFDTVESVFHDWHYDHPRILYALMRSLRPEIAVEVGTYRGYAACYMAQACKENNVGHVFCIDDFSEGMQKKYDADHWRDNIEKCGVTPHVTLVIGKSTEVQWPKKVDFVYIDGWHSYSTALVDFNAASSRAAECICLDDVTSTVGPSLLVKKIRETGVWDVLEIFRDCGLAVCIRRKPKPPCNFSQELLGNPGTVMTGWTLEEKRAHLSSASLVTSVDYTKVDL